ncbi:Uncharacterized protein APZ42_027753 [Daphnia magna]|uniref:Uncharacterized protein n=1 Tax=Daphnia magna TaxID=35525 RepID=A0A164R2I2_9CRUS|nr:Uncharacterized protein APZ42_027753 [Daphnia magna]
MGESTNQKASLYKCLFKGCKQKTNKDGTPKYLKIKDDSRGNGKRHYLAHYPNNELKHEEKWKLAVRKMTSKDNIGVIHRAPTIQHILKQSDFENYVLNFIIVYVLTLYEVEKEKFKSLMSGVASPHLKLHGRTFYTTLLEKEYANRHKQLKHALFNCSDAATTIDAWTCRRRSYLGETGDTKECLPCVPSHKRTSHA